MIRKGKDTAEPVDLELEEDEDFYQNEAPQVRVGGPDGEWVAFHSRLSVRLFKVKEGSLERVFDVSTPPRNGFHYQNNVRFSPDGKEMIVSSQGRTFLIPTERLPEPEVTEIKISESLGDYTRDGRFFIFFDEGGGWMYRTDDWEYAMDKREVADHPVHCCPIVDASTSPDGKLILSNDGHSLLLWSDAGKQLAQLFSPREKDEKRSVLMQSPMFPWRSDRIFAGDGWEILLWNVDDILRAASRGPINTPRVPGKIVVSYGRNHEESALMNISLGAEEKDIVTAKGTAVQHWSDAGTIASEPLLVPDYETSIRPRSFHMSEKSSGIFMRNGTSLTLLDPERKNQPVRIDRNAVGIDVRNGFYFQFDPNSKKKAIRRLPLAGDGTGEDEMTVPPDWHYPTPGDFLVSENGKMLFVLRQDLSGKSAFSVIDWTGKKVIYDQKFPFSVTSFSVSEDESKLVLGSHQRAIYVLDLKKICDR